MRVCSMEGEAAIRPSVLIGWNGDVYRQRWIGHSAWRHQDGAFRGS